jgi:4'-phosphopantetheinyl transferase
MIVVLISKNRAVGIDVECLPYRGPCLDIAERFFSPTEVSTLHSLPSSYQPSEFIKYWTLKESYVKARGTGLSISLGDFFFQIHENPKGRIDVCFAPALNDHSERWQFDLHSIGDQYVVATAIERHSAEILYVLRCEMPSLLDLSDVS